jgi:hypothetical protein
MHFPSKVVAITGLLLSLLATGVQAEVSSTTKHTSREDRYSFPINAEEISHRLFTPSLISNSSPELCSAFEKEIEHGQGPSRSTPEAITDAGNMLEVPIAPISLPFASRLTSESAVIQNEGKQQTVLMRATGSWGGGAYSDHGVYLKDGVVSTSEIPWDSELEDWTPVFHQIRVGWPFEALTASNTLYLVKSSSDKPEQPSDSVGLYQVHPSGELEQLCLVRAAPIMSLQGRNVLLGKQTDNSPTLAVNIPPKLNQFFDDLDKIDGGSSYGGCGTGRAWSYHEQGRISSRVTSLVSPWAPIYTNSATLYDTGNIIRLGFNPLNSDVVLTFLNDWGLASLYNYRIIKHIKDDIPEAQKALADFYKEEFGLKDESANKAAALNVGRIITASLELWSFHDWDVSEEENLDLDSFAKKYREKLTNHKALPDWYVRKAILNDMQELVQETSKEDLIASGQGIPEPLVIYGLDDPEMTKLLIAKGMDVNAPNWFGKTALMYAAQWNMPQMVKLLIETHADVNAATTPVGQQVCDSGPTITGRTALMYAAENASLPVIQTLLDAGADKTKKDSTNRRAWNYLMGNRLQVVNPNLKGNDLETAKQLLEFDVSKE